MDYGRLIRDACSMAWRHKFLWLIGMFAPSSIGSCSGSNSSYQFPDLSTGRRDIPSEFSDLGPVARQASSWFASNTWVIVAIAGAVLLLLLAFAVVSFIAQGAMVRSTGDLAAGQPSGLRSGLRAGLRHFWRYLGLWAITTVAVVAFAVAIAMLVGVGVLMASVGGAPVAAVVIIAGVLIGIPLLLVAIVGGIAVGIILAFARRAIVIDDVGPIAAIRLGFLLFRRRLGPSLLTWLVSLGLGIGLAIATFIVVILVLLVLALPAIIAVAVASFTPVVIGYAVVALLAFLAVAWVVSGALNAFYWSYWTLAYLRLSGEAAAGASPLSPAQTPLAPAGGSGA
jgi:hypothetical protein